MKRLNCGCLLQGSIGSFARENCCVHKWHADLTTSKMITRQCAEILLDGTAPLPTEKIQTVIARQVGHPLGDSILYCIEGQYFIADFLPPIVESYDDDPS